MPDPLIAWPVTFAASSYVVRVGLDNVFDDLTFPASGSLTPGRYYWVSSDRQADASSLGGVGDVLEMLERTLATHVNAAGDALVELNSSFRVEASDAGAGVISILWSHANTTLDASIFGWEQGTDAVSDPATLITSPNLPRGLWRPRRGCIDSRNRQPVVGGVARSISGLTRVSRFALPERERELGFLRLPQQYVLDEYAAATEPHGAFESAWIDAISRGFPLRFYEDESTFASGASAYSLYRTRSMNEPHQRDQQADRTRWAVNLQLSEVTQ